MDHKVKEGGQRTSDDEARTSRDERSFRLPWALYVRTVFSVAPAEFSKKGINAYVRNVPLGFARATITYLYASYLVPSVGFASEVESADP